MAEQMVTYAQAMNQALKEEMRRDERVIMWGEDLVSKGGMAMEAAGIFEEFGQDRILDTPIVEVALVEAAVGAALAGLRPVTEIMFGGLLPMCLDLLAFPITRNEVIQSYFSCVSSMLVSILSMISSSSPSGFIRVSYA